MTNEPVAVVGIAAELPSGNHSSSNLNYDSFHGFLMDKKDAYVTIPKERMNIEAWQGKGLGQSLASRGAFLKHVGQFDPTEFGITAKDARAMAVSTRKLVELSFLALLDSGIDYRGRNVGCYASATAFDLQSIAEPDEMEPKGSLAGIPCMVSNRISYHLDLRGPSIPIDTACSSSAVAMHLAAQAIRNGECDAAVVAGCQLNLRASDFALYTQASILAPDGKCKPFDAEGNGFSRGEGAVVAVIKPLSTAIRDGDHIYGTVLGTGVSSCGSMAPVNAPVAEAQANAMERAYSATGRHPSEVDYVEVHGTGTKAGDPTEANWVGERFARSSELLIGSVKGNIGHLEITSFLASMCKVCSIFRYKQVQPNVHLNRRNPAILWEEYRLRVATEAEPISARSKSGNLLISICSSGIGGVNAHVVMESYPNTHHGLPLADAASPVLFVAGGLSPRSAGAVGESIKEFISKHPDNAIDSALIYGRRARSLTWRSFSVKQPGQTVASFSTPVLAPRIRPPIVFLFSGQGPQHLHMGRQLFQVYPVFRRTILELDSVYTLRTGRSLVNDIGLFGKFANTALPSVWPISLILPSITAVQIALFDLLISFGIHPDILIGHSAGETSLLYASGAGPKEMALEISIARGEAMTIVEEHSEGTMAALGCSPDDANRIINSVRAKHPGKVVEIACYNSPDAVALAGHAVALDEAIILATEGGFLARKIVTHVPVHCSLMEMCMNKFNDLVTDVFARYPGNHRTKTITYSTCTGEVLEHFSADYFWCNSRGAVRFTETVNRLTTTSPGALFVEMSPHPVLASYLQELGVSSTSVVAPMRRSKTVVPYQEQTNLMVAIGQLVVAGYNQANFNRIHCFSDNAVLPLKLPDYPFMKKHVDYFPELSRVMYKQMCDRNGPLNFPELRINTATHPQLAEHIINSEPIMPAAGFIEAGLEFGARTLWNIKFHSILPLSSNSPLPVEVALNGLHYTVKSRNLSSDFFDYDAKKLRLHADGYLSDKSSLFLREIDLEQVRRRCIKYDMTSFYDTLKYFAQYGPSYRRVDELYIGHREALVRIRGVDAELTKDGKHVIHPAILDASFHVCVHPALTKSTDPNVYFLPSRVNAVMLSEAFDGQALFTEHVYAHVTFQAWHPQELIYDIDIINDAGYCLCSLQGFTVARHLQVPLQDISDRYELVYQPYCFPSRPSSASCTLASSSSSDSGYISDNSEAEELLERLDKLLQYIVKTCDKGAVRILEVHAEGSPLLGQSIIQALQSAGASHPTYTIVAKHSKTVTTSSESLPQNCTIVEWDFLSGDATSKLEAMSFDVVIGARPFRELESMCVTSLMNMRSLLVPGGFLIMSLDCICDETPTTYQKLFLGAGFSFTSGISNSTRAIVIDAQAPSLPKSLPVCPIQEGTPLVISFCAGREMDVQQRLRDIDDTFDQPIWLTCSEGPSADSLQGFARTLSKEFPQWNLRWVSFDSCYSQEDRAYIMRNLLPKTGIEREFVVKKDLNILVPRIMPSSAPSESATASFQATPVLKQREVLVEVSQSSLSDIGLWTVTGTVRRVHSPSDSVLLGRTITAVTTSPPTRLYPIHIAHTARLPSHLNATTFVPILPALLILGLSIGVDALNDSSRLHYRIIVTHSKEGTGRIIADFLRLAGFNVRALSSGYTPKELEALRISPDDLIFTSAGETDQLLGSYIPKCTRVVNWTSKELTEIRVRTDPWLVSDILKAVTIHPDISLVSGWPVFKDSHLQPSSTATPRLFSAEKVYLLIGGAGSLGPYVALWMYQRGARRVTLTSRSGRETIQKMQDSLPSRVFHYLEQQSDLTLDVQAADATDANAMRRLIGNMGKPLGGCIFLAATFDDRLFFAQDEKSFARSYSSKVGVIDALESVMDLSTLEFMISLSSGTVWGNAGQTNYTSANTALDGRLKRYKNAFSVAAPAIWDTTSMTGIVSTADARRASHLSTWACSPAELCSYLEDGILKLADSPFNVYVPLVDFAVLEESLGVSSLYRHLISKSNQDSQDVDGDDLQATLKALVLQYLDVSADEFSFEVPLTAYGLDSLSAGRLSFALRPWIAISQMQLLGDLSLSDLEARVQKTMASNSSSEPSQKGMTVDVTSTAADIDKIVKKFSLGLDTNTKRFSGKFIPNSVVLITGTTGGLGSYLLSSLLQDDRVEKVYAFNRPSTSSAFVLERQQSAFQDRELDVTVLSSKKLVFIEGDATKASLGLAPEMYESLKQSVTAIIHNAWRLDLNSPLKTFLPNIEGTRNLVDLALSSRHVASVRFGFISSIASVQGWKEDTEVPEELLGDSRTAVLRGYGESKYVAEKIIARSGLQSSIFRVGQLCGPVDSGAWSLSEWIPMLVKTSVGLKALPDAGGVVSWLPMDKVSPIVLDVILSSSESVPSVVNVVHPRPVSWHSLMSEISAALAGYGTLPLIPFNRWISDLEKKGMLNDEQVLEFPALKLLDRLRIFAERCPPLDLSAGTDIKEAGGWPRLLPSLAASKTLSGLLEDEQVVGKLHVHAWVDYWHRKGLITLN